MKTDWALAMFEQERAWLESQPDMIPWDEGCRRLAQRVRDWVSAYSASICESVVDDDHAAHLEHAERLWRCLAHHWQQAAEANGRIDAATVAGTIQSGQGYQGGGRLGGDPMRDVVLAVAMTSRDGKAPTVFHADYYDYSRGLAGKLNRRLAANPDEWWNDLVDHLAGYTKPPGRLSRFFGRCALRNWLGTVQWNFLKRWIRREWRLANAADVDDLRPIGAPADREAGADDSVRCFVQAVRQVLAGMPKDDVLLLYYVHARGLKQKDVASILGIVPGNVARRRQKALDRLKQGIERAAPSLFGPSADSGIREEIMGDPSRFAQRLCRAIEEAQENRQ